MRAMRALFFFVSFEIGFIDLRLTPAHILAAFCETSTLHTGDSELERHNLGSVCLLLPHESIVHDEHSQLD